MRAAVFLPDCQEGCGVRSAFLLVLSPLIEQNTEQHMCFGVDWLRDEPLSRLSAITTVPRLGLTFIGPHCAVRCVTFPLGWDKPVTAGPDGLPLPPLPPPLGALFLSPNVGKPLPGRGHRSELP